MSLMKDVTFKLQKIQKEQKLNDSYEFKLKERTEILYKLEQNINYNKSKHHKIKIPFTKELIGKLEEFLKIFLGNKFKEYVESYDLGVQTETTNIAILEHKICILEKENENLNNNIKNLNKQIKLLEEELIITKQEIIEKSFIINSKEEENKKFNITINKLTDENIFLNDFLEQNKLKLKEQEKNYEELTKLKLLLDNNRDSVFNIDPRLSRISVPKNLGFQFNNSIFFQLINKNLLSTIFKYLEVEDIANIKLCANSINDYIEKDSLLSNRFLMKIIKRKNDKILELKEEKNFLPLNEEYLTNNESIENLLKNYIKMNKNPGEQLKIAFAKSVDFIENNIKAKLENSQKQQFDVTKIINKQHDKESLTSGNITPNKIKDQTNNQNSHGYGGFLGVFGGLFSNSKSNNVITSNENKFNLEEREKNKSKKGDITPLINSPKSNKSLQKSDNASISTLSANNKTFDQTDSLIIGKNKLETIISEFAYTPFELNKIFKDYIRREMSNNEVQQFFNLLVQWFSEVLFSTKIALNEVKDLIIVKDVLNTRYKAYLQRSIKLEKEIERYKFQQNDNLNFKCKLDEYKEIKSKQENEIKLLENEIIKIKASISESFNMISLYKTKWLGIEEEFIKYKKLYKEELRRLLNKIKEFKDERKIIISVILGLKKMIDEKNILNIHKLS